MNTTLTALVVSALGGFAIVAFSVGLLMVLPCPC
jgi:hypothetical protein